jgi:exonuclease III
MLSTKIGKENNDARFLAITIKKIYCSNSNTARTEFDKKKIVVNVLRQAINNSMFENEQYIGKVVSD